MNAQETRASLEQSLAVIESELYRVRAKLADAFNANPDSPEWCSNESGIERRRLERCSKLIFVAVANSERVRKQLQRHARAQR